MIDVDTALVSPDPLPCWFLEKLKAPGGRTVETIPDDDDIITSLRLIQSPREQDALHIAGKIGTNALNAFMEGPDHGVARSGSGGERGKRDR
jgi:Xaa-Pro aminopeptidase